MIKPTIKMRIAGSTPVEKWINLIKRWNRYSEYNYQVEGMHQALLITIGEAINLKKQYPDLYREVEYKVGILNHFQEEALEYGEYEFKYHFPRKPFPKPKKINGITLFDNYGL